MRLDPAMSAAEVLARVFASSDTAPARCVVAGRPVRVMGAQLPADLACAPAAGELLIASKCVYLGCVDGAIELLSVKPDGKRQMDAAAWAAGLHEERLPWEKLS